MSNIRKKLGQMLVENGLLTEHQLAQESLAMTLARQALLRLGRAIRRHQEERTAESKLALDEARRRFELAARLGSPLMVCTPPLEKN